MSLYESQGLTFGEAVRFATMVETYRVELAGVGASEAEIDDVQRMAYKTSLETVLDIEMTYRLVFEAAIRNRVKGTFHIPRLTDRAFREHYRKTTLYQARYARRVARALLRNIWAPIRLHLRAFLAFWHGR